MPTTLEAVRLLEQVEEIKAVQTIDEAGEEIPETERVEHVKEVEEDEVERVDSQVSNAEGAACLQEQVEEIKAVQATQEAEDEIPETERVEHVKEVEEDDSQVSNAEGAACLLEQIEEIKAVQAIQEAGDEIPETERVERVKEVEEDEVERVDSEVSNAEDMHLRSLATWKSVERLLLAHPEFDRYRNKYIRSKVACGRAHTYADLEQLLKERHQPVDQIFLLAAMSRLSWFDWTAATTPLKRALDVNGISADVQNYLAGNLYKNYQMSTEIHSLGQFLLSQMQDAKSDGIYLAVAFDACTQAYNYYKHNKIL
ncbi:MAG: hypothetical protein KVP17_002700 [Porospora cf. gigantea B]|uniref:uncharacterized protein n=1 Tax=Porospora cf. gigantea B TaxID=2853592 RepID=UPI003571AE0E|nr:MAG: hypothetical protein KVP17_002700 [Porospora cf. gigantea B]